MFRNIKNGIKNLIIWTPIIWKDKQWDHHFLLVMLNKKLKLMEDYFEDGEIISDSKKVAKQIRMARIAVERLKKDQYEITLFDKHYEKWGEMDFSFTKCKDKPGLSKLDITHPKAQTKKEIEQERKETNEIWKKIDILKKQDIDLFCKMFKKHLFSWWE